MFINHPHCSETQYDKHISAFLSLSHSQSRSHLIRTKHEQHITNNILFKHFNRGKYFVATLRSFSFILNLLVLLNINFFKLNINFYQNQQKKILNEFYHLNSCGIVGFLSNFNLWRNFFICEFLSWIFFNAQYLNFLSKLEKKNII